MGKSSGSAPASPDPATTIPLQTQANMQMFDQALNAQRTNSYGPTGSQTWSNAPTFDEAGYNQALEQWRQSQQSPPGLSGRFGQMLGQGTQTPAPSRDDYTRDIWTQTTTLSPEQQALYDRSTQAQQAMTNQVAGQAGQPLDFSGAPSLTGSLNQASLSSNYFQPYQAVQVPNQTSTQSFQGIQAPNLTSDQSFQTVQAPTVSSNQSFQGIQAPNLTSNQSFQGVNAPQLNAQDLQQISQRGLSPGQLSQGVNEALQSYNSQIGQLDPMQFNQQAADAIYGQGTRYLDPAIKQQQSSMEARLAEQGFVPGTPAYNQAMTNFMDTSNRAYADARDRATSAGVSSGQANFGNRLGALQSQITTALQGGNFQNSQQAQDFSQQQAQAAQDRQIGLDRNAVMSANDSTRNALAQQNFQNQSSSAQQNFQNQAAIEAARNAASQGNFQNQSSAAQQLFQNQGTAESARNQAALQNFQTQSASAQQAFQNQAAMEAARNQVGQQNFQNQTGAAQQLFQNQGTIDAARNNALQANFQNQQGNADRTFANNMSLGQQLNSVAQQGFQNQLTAGQFGNQARNQSIAEILQQRNQPLNELNALRSGSQVQMPQGAGSSPTPNLQAPDIMGAYNNQYMGQLGAYNAQVGQDNATTGTMGQLAMAAAMYF
jgi:hypothetical protein